MKKKICYINCSARGSTGNLISDLSNYCSDDYEFCYIFGDVPKKHNKNNTLLIAYNSLLYKKSRVQSFIFGNDGFLSLGYSSKIIKFLRKQKPDLVHLHNPHRSFFNIDSLFEYCQKNNINIIWTLHDEWAITGRCCCTLDCKDWQTGCKKCKHKNYYPRCLFNRSAYFFKKKRNLYNSFGDHLTFVTPSRWLCQRVQQASVNNNCLIINNGIDTGVFKLTNKNETIVKEAKGRMVIGGAALFLNDSKGLDTFKELACKLSPDNYLIVLVGSSKKEIEILSDNLIILPRTSSKNEMASFYNSIDIFVNPTKSDNFPTTHLESIACGTPVITYNVGGASEAIREGINGFAVEFGNVDEIINKIKVITKSKDLRDRQKVMNSRDNSLKECCSKYKQLYASTIK